MMMIRRPRAGDTEEDLLAFQEEFLASGTRSSARVATSTAARPGEKRTQANRDVVNLLPTTSRQHGSTYSFINRRSTLLLCSVPLQKMETPINTHALLTNPLNSKR